MRLAQRAAAVGVMSAGALLLPTGAAASAASASSTADGAPGRPATAAEAAAIDAAVHHSAATGGVPQHSYTVTDDRVSTRDPAWAFAVLRPTDPHALDPATVVLQRVRDRWSVRELGTAEVGCDVAPRAVLREFAVTCG